jgi:hypothetical protein
MREGRKYGPPQWRSEMCAIWKKGALGADIDEV